MHTYSQSVCVSGVGGVRRHLGTCVLGDHVLISALRKMLVPSWCVEVPVSSQSQAKGQGPVRGRPNVRVQLGQCGGPPTVM